MCRRGSDGSMRSCTVGAPSGRGCSGPRCSAPSPRALRAEESLAAAATRAVHEPDGPAADVWAVDLSGPDACFAVDVLGSPWRPAGRVLRPGGSAKVAAIPCATVAFRPLTRADLPDVVTWQSRPHVARWWSDEASDVAGAEAHYGPALDGDDPTRMWVLEVNGRSVGMLQDYLVGDHADSSLLDSQARRGRVRLPHRRPELGRLGGRHPDAVDLPARRGAPALSAGARAVRGARPPQRRRRCGCSTSSGSPAACGSTSRSPTAASTPWSAAPSTWPGSSGSYPSVIDCAA